MHIALAYSLLSDPACNVLALLDSDAFQVVRHFLIQCVMATDMSKHVQLMDSFALQIIAAKQRADSHQAEGP